MELLKIEMILIKQFYCAVIVLLLFLLQAKEVKGEALSFRVVGPGFVENLVECLAVEKRSNIVTLDHGVSTESVDFNILDRV